MKKNGLLFTLILMLAINSLQAQTADELNKTAVNYLKTADYANAIIALNRSIQLEPNNASTIKNLALTYYYQKDNPKALETIKQLLDDVNGDDQSYQIAGSIYRQQEDLKEAQKLYKKGLKKFPTSGPLYSELGEVQLADKNIEAIKTWENGIKADPNYSRNYYNAAKFYFFTKDRVWSLIYGETFINLEPKGERTDETKQLLIDGYKKLFANPNLLTGNVDKNKFVLQYLNTMNQQTSAISQGINVESLTMVRTLFIVNWFGQANKHNVKLFDYQQQLLKEGMFDAYNQWLFGVNQNAASYQNWIKTHAEENNAFLKAQKARLFKVPAGQYYH